MSVPDTPYTRDEMYLSAIADGDSSGIPDRPYTRKEKYLDAIATGDSSGIPDTPYTREEMYLDAIAKNGGGGGGGGGSTLINKSVSENGTYNASDDNADGYKKVTVNVPNSYAVGDEGKVVSNGQLVAQSAHAEVNQNGTIDTTLNDSVVVNVPTGGGSSWTLVGSAEFTVNTTSTSEIDLGNIPLDIDDIKEGDVFVTHVRDKAGKRYGYFYGSDSFAYTYGSPPSAQSLTFVIRRSNNYAINSGSYGVWGTLSVSGKYVKVRAKYHSTYSLVIDGTYIVKIYKLSPPPGEAWLE